MTMIVSKRGSVAFFQQNDQNYYLTNKNYFDRGQYARPWPAGYQITGAVQTSYPVTGLTVDALKCDGSPVPGYSSTYAVQANNITAFWHSVPADYMEPFYIRILAFDGTYVEQKIYENTLPATTFVPIDIERGIVFTLTRNAFINKATCSVNITGVSAQPITYRIYLCNPHNIKEKVQVATGVVATLVGLTGAQLLDIPIFGRMFNAGDVIIIGITQGVGDSIAFPVRETLTEFDPYGYVYNSNNTFLPRQQTVAWKIYTYDGVASELIQQTNDSLIQIKTINNNQSDLIAALNPTFTWIRGNFWQPNYPQEYEDIEIAPGQFTRLRNEWNRTRQFETDYMPGYGHEHFMHILGCDNVTIDGTEVIQRNPYDMPFSNRHYGLAKAKVLLTEKNSIIRNII